MVQAEKGRRRSCSSRKAAAGGDQASGAEINAEIVLEIEVEAETERANSGTGLAMAGVWKSILDRVSTQQQKLPPDVPLMDLGTRGELVQFPRDYSTLAVLARHVVEATNEVVTCEAAVMQAEADLLDAREQRQQVIEAYNKAQLELGITGVQKA